APLADRSERAFDGATMEMIVPAHAEVILAPASDDEAMAEHIAMSADAEVSEPAAVAEMSDDSDMAPVVAAAGARAESRIARAEARMARAEARMARAEARAEARAARHAAMAMGSSMGGETLVIRRAGPTRL